jgi:hypothetical protein
MSKKNTRSSRRLRHVEFKRDPSPPPYKATIVSRDPETGDLTIEAQISPEGAAFIKKLIECGRPVDDRGLIMKPTIAVDLLARAKLGDCDPLIRHFAAGGDLTPDERRVIASLARGNYPLPRHRAGKIETELHGRDVARFIVVLELMGGKGAPGIAAGEFGIDQSSAAKYRKAHRLSELISCETFRRTLMVVGVDEALAWKMTARMAGVTGDHIREALKPQHRCRVSRK